MTGSGRTRAREGAREGGRARERERHARPHLSIDPDEIILAASAPLVDGPYTTAEVLYTTRLHLYTCSEEATLTTLLCTANYTRMLV